MNYIDNPKEKIFSILKKLNLSPFTDINTFLIRGNRNYTSCCFDNFNNKFFIKIFLIKDYDWRYNFINELAVLNHLSTLNIEFAPRLISYDIENSWILMDYKNGKPLSNNRYNFFNFYNTKSFIDLIFEIHKIKIVKEFSSIPKIDSKFFIRKILDNKKELIKLGVSISEINYVLSKIIDKAEFIDKNSNVFSHGDFIFRNIIKTDRNKFYAVDWELAKISNIFWDLLVLSNSSANSTWKKVLISKFMKHNKVKNKDMLLFFLDNIVISLQNILEINSSDSKNEIIKIFCKKNLIKNIHNIFRYNL